MSRYDDREPGTKLYRLEGEDGFRHVEAKSFGEAISKWRAALIEQYGPNSGWDENSEPDTCAQIDDDPVIR